MRFPEALSCALQGFKISRNGWNGPNQWVCYQPPMEVPEEMVNERTRRHVQAGPLRVGGYFVMMTTAGVWQPGWLASQGDMTADDWFCVDAVEIPSTG